MDKVTQLHIVARALHSLECLRDWGALEDDDSTATWFATESWHELKHLKKALLEETGLTERDIDLGMHPVYVRQEAVQ